MKVNLFTFSSSGGAGKVAKALNEGFTGLGFQSRLIVATSGNLRSSPIERPALTAAAALDQYVLKRSGWNSLISYQRDKNNVDFQYEDADLTIFRWMNGLLGGKKGDSHQAFPNLVWGLDDMNPFTGVCHYSGECRGFETDCSSCPALRSMFSNASIQNLERKMAFADMHNPRFVAPTDWINSEFRKSRFAFGRESRKILNPIQSKFFEPFFVDTHTNQKLNVLILAHDLDDRTKGVWDIQPVLTSLQLNPNVKLTLVGRASRKLAGSLPNAFFTGPVSSELVRTHLNLNDVLLVPSFHENAATVVAEAASQGLPAIVRRVGGLPEMTNHGKSGILFDTRDELVHIFDSLNKAMLERLSERSREFSLQFQPRVVAQKYAESFLP